MSYHIKNSGVYSEIQTAHVKVSGSYVEALAMYKKVEGVYTPFYEKATGSTLPLGNIVSEYKFENNVLDTVGTNNGTNVGVTFASGLVGNTGVFAGDYVIKQPTISYNSFSVSFLVKTTTTANLIIYSERYGSAILEIATNAKKIFTRLRSSSGSGITTLYTTMNINDNVWRHIVMTFDKDTGIQSNYVNGSLNSTISYTGGSFNFIGGNSAIGVDASAYSYGKFQGSIDCLRIFDKSLSDVEISDLATQELAGTDINP